MSPIIYYSTLSLPEKSLYQLLKFQVRVKQRYITGGSWLFFDGALWSRGGSYQLQYEYRGHRTHQGNKMRLVIPTDENADWLNNLYSFHSYRTNVQCSKIKAQVLLQILAHKSYEFQSTSPPSCMTY